jgi:hypothetical protein
MTANGGPPAGGAGFTCCALYFRTILLYLFIAFLTKPARIAAGGMFGVVKTVI